MQGHETAEVGRVEHSGREEPRATLEELLEEPIQFRETRALTEAGSWDVKLHQQQIWYPFLRWLGSENAR